MINQWIYLDYNATAPFRPNAREAMIAAFDAEGNPSSVHTAGRSARAAIEQARQNVGELVNVSPKSVVFTSGATEANNQALIMGAKSFGATKLYIGSIDHESVQEAAKASGLDYQLMPCTEQGVINIESVSKLLASESEKALISIALANGETGAIQPVAEIVELAKSRGAYVHCDAVQAVGKIPVDLTALGVDLASLSAHKIGGPKGVGALIVKDGLDIEALLVGGGQENRRRSGTENVAGIAGFGAAAEAALQCVENKDQVRRLRDHMQEAIINVAPDVVVPALGADRLPNTLCIALPGVLGETQVMALDLAGFCVSAGSACSSGKVSGSHVLGAMGYDDEIAACAIRISTGWCTSNSDIDQFIEAWITMYDRLVKRKADSAQVA